MVLWMDGREKKSALPKKNCGYRSYRGYREDSTAGGVARAGVVYGTQSRDGGFFAIMWGVAKWWWMVDFLEEC